MVAPLGELWFNHKAGSPGATEAVRRALTQALDLGQLAQVLTSGAGKPVTGLVMPGGPCAQNTVGSNLPAHDVAGARAALGAAGWTSGPGGVRVKAGRKLTVAFYYLTSLGPTMQAGAELVQQMWGAVGVDVTLRGVTDAEVGQLIVGGQGAWDAALLPLTVTVPSELVPFLSGPSAPGGSNFSSIDNSAYVADVRAAASTAGAAGCPKWSAAESSLFRQADLVPFVDSTAPTFGKGATFDVSQGALLPGSIRMLG